jgi:hypothetical protein
MTLMKLDIWWSPDDESVDAGECEDCHSTSPRWTGGVPWKWLSTSGTVGGGMEQLAEA